MQVFRPSAHVGDLLSTRPAEGDIVARPWAALMNGQAPDRKTWWSVGFTRRYTIALRAPRPLAATWHAVSDTLDGSPVDAPAALGRLGLDAHLSAQRSNGLRAMVARIREKPRRIPFATFREVDLLR